MQYKLPGAKLSCTYIITSIYTYTSIHEHLHVYIYMYMFFLGKVTALGVLCCFVLFV